MRKKFVFACVLIFTCAFFIFNYRTSKAALSFVVSALYPVFIGLVFALMLNGPVRFLERRVFKFIKKAQVKRIFSLALTLICISGFITALAFIIAPGLIQSVQSLTQRADGFSAAGIAGLVEENAFLSNIITRFSANIDAFLQIFKTKLTLALSDAPSALINVVIGIAFAVFIIASKEALNLPLILLISRTAYHFTAL